MADIDYLVETEDLIRDCIDGSVSISYWGPGDADPFEFIKLFQSRSKKVRTRAIYDLIGAGSREEFEDMIQELYLLEKA